MWLDWRGCNDLPIQSEVEDFVVVDSAALDQFTKFRASHNTTGMAHLPFTKLLEVCITVVQRRPLAVTGKYDVSYVHLADTEVDHLIEWVQLLREKVQVEGKRAFADYM